MLTDSIKPIETKILIVDDVPANISILSDALEQGGYDILVATSGEDALNIVRRTTVDVILLDLVMPEMDGFETCCRLKADARTVDIPVIFITVKGETEAIVEGFRTGGVDYIVKPFQKEEVLARVETHLKISRLTKRLSETNVQLAQTNRELQQEITRRKQAEKALKTADDHLSVISHIEAERWGISGFVAKSQTMAKIIAHIRQLQNYDNISVLITGESGTGKELIARAIHYGSSRRTRPLIAVNCGAIPKELVESELFGYVKGGFTGADKDKPGAFELANGGTLFLDEIGDMPYELQVKLLRVLQEKTFMPLGGIHEKQVPEHLFLFHTPDPIPATTPGPQAATIDLPLNLQQAEALLIRRAISHAGGNMAQAARLLN